MMTRDFRVETAVSLLMHDAWRSSQSNFQSNFKSEVMRQIFNREILYQHIVKPDSGHDEQALSKPERMWYQVLICDFRDTLFDKNKFMIASSWCVAAFFRKEILHRRLELS